MSLMTVLTAAFLVLQLLIVKLMLSSAPTWDDKTETWNVMSSESSIGWRGETEKVGTTDTPDFGTIIRDDADYRKTTTIVIQLGNEGMANQLCRLAFGYAVKWTLEDDFNITSKIIVRHHERRTLTMAWRSMMLCFPKVQAMDFLHGSLVTDEFEDRWKQQQTWLGSDRLNLKSVASLNITLEEFVHVFSDNSNHPPVLPVDANITLPFLYANLFVRYDMVDRFYDRYRDLFEYDVENPECCGPRALPNESIFHARGFEVEIPRIARKRGFGELSPNKTATEILKNYQRGDKVAVLGRFPSFGQLYVDRMLLEGLDARLVETGNGEQSFCFLMSGQTEIIGLARSSFMRWASYLGNASKARLYSLKTPERTSMSSFIEFMIYNHTNLKLREKVSSELFNSETQDQIEAGRG
ncbi:hypothetical protein MHU86_8467 [Fragilaria crotonensis]|nr:hypothetical protein MHU86_8467 [Fragilaria crotonensis]